MLFVLYIDKLLNGEKKVILLLIVFCVIDYVFPFRNCHSIYWTWLIITDFINLTDFTSLLCILNEKKRFGSIAYIYRKNKLEVLGYVDKRGKHCSDRYNFTTVKRSWKDLLKRYSPRTKYLTQLSRIRVTVIECR